MNYKSIELTGDFGVDDQMTPHILSVFNAGANPSRLYFGSEDGPAFPNIQPGELYIFTVDGEVPNPPKPTAGPFQAPGLPAIKASKGSRGSR